MGCFGLFGVAFGCALIVHAVSSCFEFVQIVRLFSFVFGSVKLAPLIQVVLVLSVVLVCSGLFFDSIQSFEVEILIVFGVLRKFGCLRLFHDVSHRFSCFLLFQVVGQFRSFTMFLCVVTCSMLASFFNFCSLCCVMVCWIDSLVLVRFKLTRFGWFTSFQVA